MKKTALLIFLLSLILINNYSQQLSYIDNSILPKLTSPETPEKSYFVFYTSVEASDITKELSSLKESDFRKHSLGNEIAKRMHLLDITYSFESEVAPGSFTTKRTIRKPVVYYGIYKIEKYYRKKVKNSEISEGPAVKELAGYIEQAIILFELNTDEFELALKESEEVEEIIETFQRVKLESF
jgi:hypothetical protein